MTGKAYGLIQVIDLETAVRYCPRCFPAFSVILLYSSMNTPIALVVVRMIKRIMFVLSLAHLSEHK